MFRSIKWLVMIAVVLCGLPGGSLVMAEEAGSANQAGSAQPSLYERLGGEAAVTAVVDSFVARAATNPAVNLTRQGTPREWNPTPENVEKLKAHLTQFIVAAAGGPQDYQGGDMKTVHERMQITNAEFDAMAADLKASLDEFSVPAAEQQELLEIVGTTRKDIVEESQAAEA